MLFLTCSIHRVQAQGRVTLEVTQQMSLSAVLAKLEAQTGYRFLYDPEHAERWYKPRNLRFTKSSLHQVLQALGFAFSVKDKFILLKGPAQTNNTKPLAPQASGPPQAEDTAVRVLEDVYVIGYGTAEPYQVSSSLTKVNRDEFNKVGAGSPLELIRGKVAGLSVTRTGGNNNPNFSTAVQLRGVTTLSTLEGANQPLFVIDGIPDGNINLLQQDDIESFTVFKDGAAAAIYGARANAGVIAITTKKGGSGQPSFEYSTYVSHDVVRKRPEVLSAADYRRLMNDPANPYRGLMTDYGSSTDYYQALINTSNLTHYHYLSATGGQENSNYRASLYYTRRQGVVQQNENSQYGARINVNQRGMKNMFSFQANFAFNIRSANLNGGSLDDFEQAVQQNPTQPIRDSAGEYLLPSGVDYYNPVARLHQEQHTANTQLMAGNARITLQPLSWLKGSAAIAFSRNQRRASTYYDRDSKNSIDSFQAGGLASLSSTLRNAQLLETTVEIQKTIWQKHQVQMVTGYSYQEQALSQFSESNAGFLTDGSVTGDIGGGYYLPNGKAQQSSIRSTNKLIAFFSRIGYVYDGKYIATATLRREGSSRFGANHKWGNFPAFSIGWNVDKEGFFSADSWINKLKIRSGYGITGNQNIPDYVSLTTLGPGGQYLNNGTWFPTYGPDRNPNKDLRWEKKEEMNIGVDFSILNNRISGSLDGYRRMTTDLLANYNTQVPPFITNSLYTNVGAISNKGIELSVKVKVVEQRDIGWNLELIGNTQHNKLVSLSNDVFKANYFQYGNLPAPGSLGFAIRAQEGMPLGSFYGKRFAGFTPEGKWLFYKADGSKGTASQMTQDDLSYIGNGVPKYMASLSNEFRYKQFGLSFLLTGKFGFKILNLQNMYFGNKKWIGNNVLTYAFTKYNVVNDDPQYSDFYLEPGDFIKLDNLTLNYDLPWVRRKATAAATGRGTAVHTSGGRPKGIRIYVTMEQLAVITKYSGLDPEVEDTGLSTGLDNRGFYPPTRTITLGINMQF
jgi:TonB-linked SusC/RagA family outer membrane protein